MINEPLQPRACADFLRALAQEVADAIRQLVFGSAHALKEHAVVIVRSVRLDQRKVHVRPTLGTARPCSPPHSAVAVFLFQSGASKLSENAAIPTASPVFRKFNGTAVQADLACDYDPLWPGVFFANSMT